MVRPLLGLRSGPRGGLVPLPDLDQVYPGESSSTTDRFPFYKPCDYNPAISSSLGFLPVQMKQSGISKPGIWRIDDLLCGVMDVTIRSIGNGRGASEPQRYRLMGHWWVGKSGKKSRGCQGVDVYLLQLSRNYDSRKTAMLLTRFWARQSLLGGSFF